MPAAVDQMWKEGIVLCAYSSGRWVLSVGGPKLGGTSSIEILTGTAAALPRGFSNISLQTEAGTAAGTLNGVSLFDRQSIRTLDCGFAALGASDWYGIVFDDVVITQAGSGWHPTSPCPAAVAGSQLFIRPCASNGLTVPDQAFKLLADWGILHIESNLCVTATAATAGARLVLGKCDPSDLKQQFKNDYTRVRNEVVPFKLKANSWGILSSLHLVGSLNDNGVTIERLPSLRADVWSSWSYFPNSKQLRNQYLANTKLGYPSCLTTCQQ